MTVLKKLSEDLGRGEHSVVLNAIREVEHDRFGINLIWEFECVVGEQKGSVHHRRTGSKLKRGTSLWLIVSGMLGRELSLGESIDTDNLVSKKFKLRLREEERANSNRDESDLVTVFDSIEPLEE